MRWISTVVLPLPAPAKRRSGPSVASTPSSCRGFIWENSRAMSWRRKAAKRVCCSSESMLIHRVFLWSVFNGLHCTPNGDL